MVKRRYQKRYDTEFSDESESDSDEFLEEDLNTEAPKKYSLRQRRGANLAEDFDYEVADDNETTGVPGTDVLRSDDEDFELTEASKVQGVSNKDKTIPVNCTVTKYKERDVDPEIPKSNQSSSDMIDFEDVIRADILVNKNKIDYDSIIEKSEIKIEKKPKTEDESNKKSFEKVVKLKKNGEPPKKRGRKPKKISDDYYEKLDSDSTGLPINTVLGVTESLYELAERYHLEGGMMQHEMVALPQEAIMDENISADHVETALLGSSSEVAVQQSEPHVEAIEIF